MKFLFIFLTLCLAAVSCSFLGEHGPRPATKEFLVRQKNILRLLNHVTTKNLYDDQVHIAHNWNFVDHKNMFVKDKVVDDFYNFFVRTNLLLSRGKIFSIANHFHRKQAISLFHLFYYAKDFSTFYNTACWAREHVNEGMFVYSLTVAILHRPDTKGFVLPAPYEIYPYFFVNSVALETAYRLKIQGTVYDQKLAKFYGIDKVDKTFYITTNYTGAYQSINEETKISYFMEDIGLNSYYFYFHADYPFWMGGSDYGLNKDRRGEMFFYFYQQILARYYMERLSNGLGEIPKFSWNMPIKTGFLSNLKFGNGLSFPSRPNFYNVRTIDHVYDLQEVEDYERRIRDAVYKGFVLSKDGAFVRVSQANDIDILGNIIQGNVDSPNNRFYRYLGLIVKGLIGNSLDPISDFYDVPAVLEVYETAMRDPMFYQIYQRFIHYAIVFKNTLPFYSREQLNFLGVKVEDVTVDKLVTFFDYFNIDVANALYRKEDEVNRKTDEFMYVVRQPRLNHVEFNVKIDISSDKGSDSIVRIFLGPKYDSMNRLIDINENRINFFELDTFMYTLKTGKNTIVRNSRDFMVSVKDRTMTRDLLKHIDSSLTSNTEFMLDMSEAHTGFPDRLILPKGTENGMPFMFFVMVTPYTKPVVPYADNFNHFMSAGIGSGARYISKEALGYPFDRRIVQSEFFTDNMYFKDVLIHHKSSEHFYTVGDKFMDTGVHDFVDKSYVDTSVHGYVDKSFMDSGVRDFMDQKFMTKDFYNPNTGL